MAYGWDELLPYIDYSSLDEHDEYTSGIWFNYHSHSSDIKATEAVAQYPVLIIARVPVSILCMKLNVMQISEVARLHGMSLNRHIHIDTQRQALANHTCDNCKTTTTLFRCSRQGASTAQRTSQVQARDVNRSRPKRCDEQMQIDFNESPEFPPNPLTWDQQSAIIDRFCHVFDTESVEEVGCAVCGQLTLLADTVALNQCHNMELLVSTSDCTRSMRDATGEKISALEGPVLATGCGSVCSYCAQSLKKNKIPLFRWQIISGSVMCLLNCKASVMQRNC